MSDKVNVFTMGFDNNVAPQYHHMESSKDYLKQFNDRGYYMFVETRLYHNCEISGEFNSNPLTFRSALTGNLIQAEISVESIKKGENIFKIILTHKQGENLPPEEKVGKIFV